MKYLSLRKTLKVAIALLSSIGVFLCMKNYEPLEKIAVLSSQRITALPVTKNLTLINAVLEGSFFKLDKFEATVKCQEGKNEHRMRFNKNLLNEIPQGPFRGFTKQPGDLPNIVHYVWCSGKKFQFEDYLGFLSFVRIIRPIKIIFHYNELPKVSDYHRWFHQLIQSLPQLVLRKTDKRLKCGTVDSLNFGLEQLAASPGGGMYFGVRVALTYIPSNWKTEKYFSYTIPGSATVEQIVIYTKCGLVDENETFDAFKSRLLSKAGVCLHADQFNKEMKTYVDVNESSLYDGVVSPCVVLPERIYPKNIINVDTPFAANFRRIFYGKTELLVAKPSKDPNDLIPLISHYVIFATEPNQRPEWTFPNYMSVLSALYVAGLERVYIHGNQVPKGQWWDRLQNENVTFVYIERVETVYQQKVDVLAHDSDILRLLILSKYGGVYQDNDVIWGNRVTEELRAYPIVFSYDWAQLGELPDSLNNGVIMSKANSPFLHKFLEAYWLHKDHLWTYNGVEMPYKVYEMNPESIYVYNRLQVMCTFGVCHPTWHPDYHRPLTDLRKPTGNFSLDEVLAIKWQYTIPDSEMLARAGLPSIQTSLMQSLLRWVGHVIKRPEHRPPKRLVSAYHFLMPKPDPSFVSFETIKNGTNIAAKIGQKLLTAIEKSGRKNLLP